MWLHIGGIKRQKRLVSCGGRNKEMGRTQRPMCGHHDLMDAAVLIGFETGANDVHPNSARSVNEPSR